jgi:hypothetical protein
MLTENQNRRLQSLHNRYTNYEVAIIHPNGVRCLVAYTSKTRDALIRALRDDRRASYLVRFAGSENFHIAKPASAGVTLGEWSIRFTGRTERQAILEGELPYFKEEMMKAVEIDVSPNALRDSARELRVSLDRKARRIEIATHLQSGGRVVCRDSLAGDIDRTDYGVLRIEEIEFLTPGSRHLLLPAAMGPIDDATPFVLTAGLAQRRLF